MPRGARVRWWLLGLGMALALAAARPRPAASQSPPASLPPTEPKLLYHRESSFRIPFNVLEADRPRIQDVQLFYSIDRGQTWKFAGRANLEQTHFPPFRARQDAEYWFAVRTIDTKGRPYPDDDASVVPNMKVIVDTTPPTLELIPGARRGEWASVSWRVSDDYLKVRSFVIEYQAEGASNWRQVPIRDFVEEGTVEWRSGTAGALYVRAMVEDEAGNHVETRARLADGIAAQPAPAQDDGSFEPPPPIAPIAHASLSGPSGRLDGTEQDGFRSAPTQSSTPASSTPTEPGHLLVPLPRFTLKYAVEDAGVEGPALVELWVTRDNGQSWGRLPPDPDRVSPYDVDLGDQGTFGLWLVVQSAASLGDRPPRPGDRPQMWVDVDATPPDVRLDIPRIGTGSNLGKLLLTWSATDPHLGSRPILLSYRADRPDAPWLPITERLDNSGRYIWTMPSNVPPRIHVRIDVIDRLGNRASAETTAGGPILVDLSRPKGRILGLGNGAGTAGDTSSRR